MPPLVDVDVESLLLDVAVPFSDEDDVLVMVSVSEDSVVDSVVVE